MAAAPAGTDVWFGAEDWEVRSVAVVFAVMPAIAMGGVGAAGRLARSDVALGALSRVELTETSELNEHLLPRGDSAPSDRCDTIAEWRH